MSSNDQDHPGVIALPPFIFLGFLLAGLALEYLMPSEVPAALARYLVGGGLAIAGLGLAFAARGRFVAAGTNVRPTLPATALVTQGPYRFTRNPMYLALTAIYFGIAIAVGSWWLIVLTLPLLLVMEFGVIRREERYLAAKFGTAYTDYMATVRRWL